MFLTRTRKIHNLEHKSLAPHLPNLYIITPVALFGRKPCRSLFRARIEIVKMTSISLPSHRRVNGGMLSQLTGQRIIIAGRVLDSKPGRLTIEAAVRN